MEQCPVVWPEDTVLLGRVANAYGIQGWIKVQPYSGVSTALLSAAHWWLKFAEQPQQIGRYCQVQQSRWQHGSVVAQLAGVTDRGAAEALRGAEIWLARRDFPAVDADEYYWVDLQGCQVLNHVGIILGVVDEIFNNGAHDVLAVRALEVDKPRLIPFVDAYVREVNQAARQIVVEWSTEWDAEVPPKRQPRAKKRAVEPNAE